MTNNKKNYQEFKGLSSRFDIWTKFIDLNKISTMVEIGVWKGDFAANILQHSKSIETYFMIDPWAKLSDWNKPFNVEDEKFEIIFDEMKAKTAFAANKLKILRGRTKEVVSAIADHQLDFAYIDGDHTLRGITTDLIKIWPKIKLGGYLGGDDFTTTPWQHDARFEPTLVCPFAVYFAEAMNVPITVLEHGQFLIHKDENCGFSFNDTTGLYTDLSLNKLSEKTFK